MEKVTSSVAAEIPVPIRAPPPHPTVTDESDSDSNDGEGFQQPESDGEDDRLFGGRVPVPNVRINFFNIIFFGCSIEIIDWMKKQFVTFIYAESIHYTIVSVFIQTYCSQSILRPGRLGSAILKKLE